MEFYQAVVLFCTVLLVLTLSSRVLAPAFLSLILGALFFAILARMSLPSIGDSFSLGFAQALDSLALFIIAGCIVAAFTERSGAAALFAPHMSRGRRSWPLVAGLLACLAPNTVALALMRPWCLALSSGPKNRKRNVAVLALALSAGQAFVYPSFLAVATSTILKAEIGPMLATGIVLALATSVAGWFFVDRALGGIEKRPGGAAAASARPLAAGDVRSVVLPVLVPLVLFAAAAVAQIPSEPLGRTAKEFLVFATRPAVVILLSLGLTLLILRRWDRAAISEAGWLGEALAASVKPILAVGAAGGLAALIQQAGPAELISERATMLHAGIAVPFLAAAASKLVQGSPLVAVLTAAGMSAPLLGVLGLDTPWGHAFAAGAIGAGSLLAHVNDPYFWLVNDMAGSTPARTFALYSLATLVQAIAAIVLLTLLSAVTT